MAAGIGRGSVRDAAPTAGRTRAALILCATALAVGTLALGGVGFFSASFGQELGENTDDSDGGRSHDRHGPGHRFWPHAVPLFRRHGRQSDLHRSVRQAVAAIAAAQGGHPPKCSPRRQGPLRRPRTGRASGGLLPPRGPLHVRQRYEEGTSPWPGRRERVVCRPVQWQVVVEFGDDNVTRSARSHHNDAPNDDHEAHWLRLCHNT